MLAGKLCLERMVRIGSTLHWQLFTVDTCGQTGLDGFLSVAEHFELRERDVARDLHAVQSVVPLVPDIRHRVPDCNEERL